VDLLTGSNSFLATAGKDSRSNSRSTGCFEADADSIRILKTGVTPLVKT
jgi:hypothetical protein